ncbi:hypothetical protein VTJ49DRAFT_5959 [Mycothermus thermophilus]|uniref:Hydrophobin n=1 Tax=Humicola insolens TaxID=85995 RepID=A0ABR3V2C3_HUMIN
MQFTTIFTLLAAAMTASALPRESVARRHTEDAKVCGNDQATVCCAPQGMIAIGCVIPTVLGGAATCPTNFKTICCEQEEVTQTQYGLVNIAPNAPCLAAL